jgi:hypothetical protein
VEEGKVSEHWVSDTDILAFYTSSGAGQSSHGFKAGSVPKRVWGYFSTRSGEDVAVVPKQYAAGFRLAGNRIAELRQGVDALNRWEALQKKDVIYLASDKLLQQFRATKQARARIATLEAENEQLRADAAVLRKLVAKQRGDCESMPASPDPDVLTKVSEFLVVLPTNYRPHAVELFDRGRLSVHDAVQALGPDAVQHFANLLGWAELAYMSGQVFVATRLGVALGESLKRTAEAVTPELSDQR